MNEDSLPGIPDIILLAGPTGSGKTRLVTELDSSLFEVVSFDSRQVYRDLPIGTTAPTTEEKNSMPHHMVGFLESCESLDANLFRERASSVLASIRDRGKIPILTAGTGFYLRAFLHGMYPVPDILPEIRNLVNEMDEARVLEELKERDFPAFEKISPNDFYRYRRALEVNLSGVKWSGLGQETEGGYLHKNPGLRIQGYFVDWDRDILYRGINDRAKSILEPMAEEAKRVCDLYGRECPGLKTLGYNFALDYLQGSRTIESYYDEIAKAHRNYAKRQITWFKRESYLVSGTWDSILGTLIDLQLLIK